LTRICKSLDSPEIEAGDLRLWLSSLFSTDYPMDEAPKLIAYSLGINDRDFLADELRKASLPANDIHTEDHMFWQYKFADQTSVGFGGLELHGKHALLRSILTLPSTRNQGVGRAIISDIEARAIESNCSTIWLLTTTAERFFERLGYVQRQRETAPLEISETQQFSSLCPSTAIVMSKSL
jgi:N-acetylglutamate synthase-like GNAT family acetyltransferase